MSLNENEAWFSEEDENKEEDDSEHFQAEDEYEDFDDLCELHSALKEYVQKNSLYLCENLTIDKLKTFLES